MDSDDEIIDEELVLQATPFTERGKDWYGATIKLLLWQKVAVTNEICTLYKLHLSLSSNLCYNVFRCQYLII